MYLHHAAQHGDFYNRRYAMFATYDHLHHVVDAVTPTAAGAAHRDDMVQLRTELRVMLMTMFGEQSDSARASTYRDVQAASARAHTLSADVDALNSTYANRHELATTLADGNLALARRLSAARVSFYAWLAALVAVAAVGVLLLARGRHAALLAQCAAVAAVVTAYLVVVAVRGGA